MISFATRATWAARVQTTTTILASQKLEQIRALVWNVGLRRNAIVDSATDLGVDPPTGDGPGLRASPADTLDVNTAGYVDFLNTRGEWVGRGRQHRRRPRSSAGGVSGRCPRTRRHVDPPGSRYNGHGDRGCAHASSAPRARGPGDDDGVEKVAIGRQAVAERISSPGEDSGFSLIELTVSLTLTLIVTGAAVSIVSPGTASGRIEPEVVDLSATGPCRPGCACERSAVGWCRSAPWTDCGRTRGSSRPSYLGAWVFATRMRFPSRARTRSRSHGCRYLRANDAARPVALSRRGAVSSVAAELRPVRCALRPGARCFVGRVRHRRTL